MIKFLCTNYLNIYLFSTIHNNIVVSTEPSDAFAVTTLRRSLPTVVFCVESTTDETETSRPPPDVSPRNPMPRGGPPCGLTAPIVIASYKISLSTIIAHSG